MKIMQLWFLVLGILLGNNVFGQDKQPPPKQQVTQATQETTKVTTRVTQVPQTTLTTDRPTFTTGSNMMDVNRFQLELGYTYTDLEHGDSSTFPEALIRYGLNKDWELRLGWDGYDFGTENGDIAQDMSFGFKWKFKDAGTVVLDGAPYLLTPVDMALITKFTLPTGSDPTDFAAETRIAWNYDPEGPWSFASNLGVGSPIDKDTGDRFFQGVASVMGCRTISEAASLFGEFYTNFPAADDNDAEYVVQTGLIHRLSDNMQFDVRVGAGLNDQAPDWLVGCGLAYRF